LLIKQKSPALRRDFLYFTLLREAEEGILRSLACLKTDLAKKDYASEGFAQRSVFEPTRALARVGSTSSA